MVNLKALETKCNIFYEMPISSFLALVLQGTEIICLFDDRKRRIEINYSVSRNQFILLVKA